MIKDWYNYTSGGEENESRELFDDPPETLERNAGFIPRSPW